MGRFNWNSKKLYYIKSMSCNIIYLSPICMSQTNHRYDTSDYLKVDPYAGSMDDLKKLCSEAYKVGIKVMLGGVNRNDDIIDIDILSQYRDNEKYLF